LTGEISYFAWLSTCPLPVFRSPFVGCFGVFSAPVSRHVTVPSLRKLCSKLFPAIGPSSYVHRIVLPRTGSDSIRASSCVRRAHKSSQQGRDHALFSRSAR